jgi:hypothetical protein
MSESVVDLRKRVKELRGAIVGSVSSAGVEELKREIAYHESAAKSAERDKKRMEALAKAREAKIAKSKSKKEGAVEPVAEKPKKVVEAKAEKPKVETKRKAETSAEGEPKPKKAKAVVAVVEEVVLSKNIRPKKVKNAEADE